MAAVAEEEASEGDGESDADAEREPDGEDLPDGDGLPDGEGLPDSEGVPDGRVEPVGEGGSEVGLVGPALRLAASDEVIREVLVALGGPVADAEVSVGVGVGVNVGDEVGVGVGVGVCVGAGVGVDVDVGLAEGEVVAEDSSAWHAVSVAAVVASVVNGAAWAVPTAPRTRKPPLTKLTAASPTCAKRIIIARLRCSPGSPGGLRAHREFGGD